MDLNDLEQIAESENGAVADPSRSASARPPVASPRAPTPCGNELDSAVTAAGLGDRVEVAAVGCMRLCCAGPLVQVDPEGALYEHVGAGPGRVDRPGTGRRARPTAHAGRRCSAPSSARQTAIVLENSGIVEPERIESYIEAGGYQALYHALHEMSPAEVVDDVTRSGLRGRGGAGYPTGVKWATVAKTPPGPKFVVCNADEGDPARSWTAASSRATRTASWRAWPSPAMPSAPTRATSTSAASIRWPSSGWTSPSSRPGSCGLLGSQIFESPFDFRIDLRIGAGAFCLRRGDRADRTRSRAGEACPVPGLPTRRTPGLWGDPTLINNVETFANVPPIIRDGADWFAGIGTAESKGTKVFALTGKVRNTGLVEVPMGTTSAHDRRGDRRRRRRTGTIKAVQTGGPSGGCIPAEHLDTPVDYESLAAARLDHGLRRHDRHGPGHQHGRTWPSSSWSSAWTNRAASASPAARAPCRCIAPARIGAGQRAHATTWTSWSPSATWSSTRAFAVWASRRRTPCSARCATSATNTRP